MFDREEPRYVDLVALGVRRIVGLCGPDAAAWSGLGLLLSVSALLFFFDFGARVLASNDEARFPVLAQDILARGDWLLPRLNGTPHLNKPPLSAWLIALASWPGGQVTQSTAALPSLLAALGVVVLTSWTARRLFGAETALVAGLIVVTTYGVFDLARVPMPDIALCLAVTAAMAAFVATEFGHHRRALIVAYALVGVASLTKGPVALLGLVVMTTYTLSVDGPPGLRRLASPTGLLLLGLLVVPWWLLGAASDRGGAMRDVAVNDWFGWYLPHGGWRWRAVMDPFAQTATVLLPWAPLVPAALWSALRAGDPMRGRRVRLPVIWASVVFILIALSHQQRMRYYLPLCPPVALLIAAWYSRITLPHKERVGAAVWLLAALGLGLWQAHAGPRYNAATDLRAIVSLTQARTKPLYAVEVPELVFTFYLKQPVVLLSDLRQFEALVDEGRDGYLVIADRVLPASSAASRVQRLGGGRVNGRAFSILAPL